MRRPLAVAVATVGLLVALLRLHEPPRHTPLAARPAAHVPAAAPQPAAATTPGRPRITSPAVHTPPRTTTAPQTSTPPTAAPRRSPQAAPGATASAVPVARRTAASTPPPPTASPARRYTGAVSDTPYGPVQVQITVQGNRITDVQALQMPSDTYRSQQLSARAAPQLRQEALQAQSANIDTISGATYTSDGYRQSLQSALDQAHLG